MKQSTAVCKAALLTAVLAFLGGCSGGTFVDPGREAGIGGGGGSGSSGSSGFNRFIGTWAGTIIIDHSSSYSVTLTMERRDWVCERTTSYGERWRGTYTYSQDNGTFTITEMKSGDSGEWYSVEGLGKGTVLDNTLTSIFTVIDSGSAKNMTAVFTKMPDE
jgi:hypothetical protein